MTDFDSQPGTLKPIALAVISALQSARNRTASWKIAREIDQDPLIVVPLLWDMMEIGLVQRGKSGVGYRSSWSLLVSGPVQAVAS